ncbi:MAG: hypothetical protein AAB494_00680 [Patescibacteria group bacterium]
MTLRERKLKKEELEEVQSLKERAVENIFWHAPEYEYSPKSSMWYWTSLFLALVLIIFALWQKNFLFAVFVFIAELIVFAVADKHPKIWEFAIDEKGVYIGKSKFYSYDQLEAFDIHINEIGHDQLVLKTKKKISPIVAINIYKEEREKIKEFLKKYIPHEQIDISFGDIISKLIGF